MWKCKWDRQALASYWETCYIYYYWAAARGSADVNTALHSPNLNDQKVKKETADCDVRTQVRKERMIVNLSTIIGYKQSIYKIDDYEQRCHGWVRWSVRRWGIRMSGHG